MKDEQYERWIRELEKEEPKEWEANPITGGIGGNMFGLSKEKKSQDGI